MWHRGDFGASPQELFPPWIAQLLNRGVVEEEKPAPIDMDKLVREASRTASAQEIIVKDDKVKPSTVEIFTQEKSSLVAQRLWIESHRVQEEERTELDKLRNFFAWGKYE